MKIRRSRLSALVACAICVLSAGPSIAQGDAEQGTPELKIYALGEINMTQYEVVGRPWVDSWRSNFSVPTFPSQEQGIAALQTEAARRGADGLLNVICLDQGYWNWSSSTDPAFVCYGIAIRVR